MSGIWSTAVNFPWSASCRSCQGTSMALVQPSVSSFVSGWVETTKLQVEHLLDDFAISGRCYWMISLQWNMDPNLVQLDDFCECVFYMESTGTLKTAETCKFAVFLSIWKMISRSKPGSSHFHVCFCKVGSLRLCYPHPHLGLFEYCTPT